MCIIFMIARVLFFCNVVSRRFDSFHHSCLLLHHHYALLYTYWRWEGQHYLHPQIEWFPWKISFKHLPWSRGEFPLLYCKYIQEIIPSEIRKRGTEVKTTNPILFDIDFSSFGLFNFYSQIFTFCSSKKVVFCGGEIETDFVLGFNWTVFKSCKKFCTKFCCLFNYLLCITS